MSFLDDIDQLVKDKGKKYSGKQKDYAFLDDA